MKSGGSNATLLIDILVPSITQPEFQARFPHARQKYFKDFSCLLVGLPVISGTMIIASRPAS
jgi:hypothetical protein